MAKKSLNTFRINGRVINRATQTGVAGLRVEGWDKDLFFNDLVGSAVTNEVGGFLIEFDESYFKELSFDRRPDLFFKVFQDEKIITSTEDSVLWNVAVGTLEIVIEVDLPDGTTQPPPTNKATREVEGTVRFADGVQGSGLIVAAFDRDFRHDQKLGESQTDIQGTYRIQYSTTQFQKPKAGGPDLIVKAFAADGTQLVTSSILFGAPRVSKIDLTIPAGVLKAPPLFERIERALKPLPGDLKIDQLEEGKDHHDLSFLAGKTGFEKTLLARFVLAHRLVQQELPAEFWFVMLGSDAVFQFHETQSLEEELRRGVDQLSSLDAVTVRKSLARGFSVNEISESMRQNTDRWTEAFLQFVVKRFVSESDEPTFIKSALEHAGIKNAKKQETLARLLIEYKGLTPELLGALEKDKSLKKVEIDDLRTSFRLAELTVGDFSVVKVLKEEFGIRQPENIRTLAKKSDSEWVNLVKTKQASGDIKLPFAFSALAGQAKPSEAEVFGKMMGRQFREAFPTTAFAGGLERALKNGGTRGLRRAQDLGRFLERHENFELLKTPVDDFLKGGLHDDVAVLAKDEAFRGELKAVQRVFKLAPTFEATDTLLADNLHSAQQVYRLGRSQFVQSYADRSGFTETSARLTWNRAADTQAAVATIMGDVMSLDLETGPKVLNTGSEALSAFPNWNSLFKTGDLCECEHCRSVLGPAAYFADLLMFLKDRKVTDSSSTTKDILFRRRPDLGYLELNCDNALTPFPYIDTVCEVLEAVVDAADRNDLELAGFTAMPADADAAKAAVAQAFTNAFTDSVNDGKQEIALGADFSLSQVDPSNDDLWVVHGEDVTYLLKKKSTPNFFAQILPNTKATAAELRAYPQYVNPKAYARLRTARYPMSLPFDLFGEEVRAAFQKTNLQRWDLMRTLRGNASPNNPTDGEIAAEYFGISSPDEKQIIFPTTPPTIRGQRQVWGESGADWLERLGNVRNFLQKMRLDYDDLKSTPLEYNDLLTLLDLPFIDPTGEIDVHHPDTSCDTELKVIQILDVGKLDRIHRFLRLWRKLKDWKMWELDLVIRQIGNGLLNEEFLIQLFYFEQLRKRLGPKTTVEHACALFHDLNTESHFTKLYEKRDDGLYQKLFLNRRLFNPVDPAFILDDTGSLAGGAAITDCQSVVLAALGISEADLVLFKGLTKPDPAHAAYINDNLTIENLSFLWRHAWLAKVLKYKAPDWKILLKLFHQDFSKFAEPKAAWEFVENVDQLKAAGFTPDEFNWLLAADRSAKAAVKETDAVRFLAALRKELQGIQAEYDPAQYDFLSVSSPTDTDSIGALLSALLQKLNRNEAAVDFFMKTLRGGVLAEASAQGIPDDFAFPATITGAPNHIPIQFDQPGRQFRFTGVMTADQRTVLLTDPSLPPAASDSPYTSAIEELFQQSVAATTNYVFAEVDVVLAGDVVLPADRPSLPIRYNSTAHKLSFIGVMTDVERLALVAAGNPANEIEQLFQLPRLAVKFYEPVFTESLPLLPSAIDFKAQLPADLAGKVSYDAEQRQLKFAGIMSVAEQAQLNALVPSVLPADLAYHGAVNRLAAQPQTIVPPDARLWLSSGDLDATQPANDTLTKRQANAARKALLYLSRTSAENAVVRQSSAQLELTEAVTRLVLTQYQILPEPLLVHLTGSFAATSGVVDYATLKTTFDGWFWANRVATLLKKWKVTLAELERIGTITAVAQLLDFLTLPLDDTRPIASIERLLRTSRLLRLRDTLPETEITFLEVLVKLNSGAYVAPVDFSADVERLNNAWLARDVEELRGSLNLAYPTDYFLAESWERLRRGFYFIENLNAGAPTVKAFAAAVMSYEHARTIKELLRSKFGEETWLVLCAEIQDVLRERKRDALVAYLLTRRQPADTPSGKWENTNDLYAYYLLDVEMSACQLTSRMVQASGSVQLFVQRCFMGLEPEVSVQADGDRGDSAWRWWKWMSKYRVWEANRKVFLWPENWIEPELKKDRSQFFKDLENELLQNEIDQYSVETAFQNYLAKLDGVAQLEIAGFYQEDDGDNAIVHVFGRTSGAEPHLYYYRRYDYRQWTPWEKVDLDIQGDYLIPAVVGKRLFLFWPVFTEVPYEEGNRLVKVPQASAEEQTTFEPDRSQKKLRLQMAVSDYRQGKWTPKRVSKEAAESYPYSVEILKQHYHFFPIDRSEADGRFGVVFDGYSLSLAQTGAKNAADLRGAFEITGCNGVPVLSNLDGGFEPIIKPEWNAVHGLTKVMKWEELTQRDDSPENDLTLENYSAEDPFRYTQVLLQTPWIFKISPPWHLSYFDKLLLDSPFRISLRTMFGSMTTVESSVPESNTTRHEMFSSTVADEPPVPVGSWLPFFYNDKKRTFFVLPRLDQYYPQLKGNFRKAELDYEQEAERLAEEALANMTPERRQLLDQEIWNAFPEEAPAPLPGDSPPPYTAEEIQQVRNFIKRFYMRMLLPELGMASLFWFQVRQFHFKSFYHSFACDFAKLVYDPLKGIPALMSRETQLKNTGFSFSRNYQPTSAVVRRPTNPRELDAYPKEVVDFSPDGAYSSYNWELFFHAPLLIANSLSKNQRFEEARDWYHFIFNPLGVEGPAPGGSPMSKYWITKPFFETTDPEYLQQRIDNMLRLLSEERSDPGGPLNELEQQVLDWRTYPFEPHRIANYRTVAYQKTVVMKYLENLIAWGDNLFRQDSMESINQATQIYILAAEILGQRPKKIPPRAKPSLESFNELEAEFDKFSNALIEVENLVPPLSGGDSVAEDSAPIPMLYFCIPHNDKQLGYWNTVADRLYKIRHCMNIEGVVRQLALFEPPIDPAALVKAVAGGVDISSALADLNAPLPFYRFNVVLQQANQVCNDVKGLGGALLSALEKKDAEAMGLLRQSQEIRLLEAVQAVREQQIEEAQENLAGLKKSKELPEIKKKYYESREFMNLAEGLSIALSSGSALIDSAIAMGYCLAGGLRVVPEFVIGAAGFGGSPHATAETGGKSFGSIAEDAALTLSSISNALSKSASIASTMAVYQRRQEDWDFQKDLAMKEIGQIECQIAGAELRVAIAEKELDNHLIQIENAKATDEFMRSKYTNQELYQWQVAQISGVYFQSHRLAYDLAKRAERCLRFELGIEDTSYINFGYWDSLKKGLLSGEKLQYDLRRLEAAYLERNRREFELIKHISLALLDPLALIQLRETGRCFFRLPEEIFDLDYPGHYFRRIKSVSLTLPCVVGPYTTASGTLRLLKNSIRINTGSGDNGYSRNADDLGGPADDDRFIENATPFKSIATSSAQNDSGVFELNFRDERYLPFEGAGAVSEWSLELFNDPPANNPDPAAPDFGRPLRQFDYNSISDAILHVKYTAREDAGLFKNGAITHLRNYFSQDEATASLRMLNLRQEFPAQWHRFLHPNNPADGNVFEFEMSPNFFVWRDVGKTLKINTIWLLARCTDSGTYEVVISAPLPGPPPAGINTLSLARVNKYGGLHFSQKDVAVNVVPTDPPSIWRLRMRRPDGLDLQEDSGTTMEVQDVIMILGYQWE